MEAISFVKLSTVQVMTGPWLTQFSIVADGLKRGGLETLSCLLVYEIGPNQVYKVLSDKANINAASNQITCFYKKEILK